MRSGLPTVVVLLLACSLARGEARDPPADVGRVSYADRDVSVQSHSVRVPEQVTRNWPIAVGDRIVLGNDSRAEITFALAVAHLDKGTDLSILELDRSRLELLLHAGTAAIEVRELQTGESVQVRAGNGHVQLRGPGDYRLESSEAGVALTVRQGEAWVEAGGSKFQQFAGEHARVAPDDTIAIARSPRADPFDRWSQGRKRERAGLPAARHVARGVVGYEDLDAHGDWRWERDYGMVWGPEKVAADWAPYRFGKWILKLPWGWTWVDDAPWGFAPAHYGRWVYLRERWYWLPGPRQISPVYSPALVRWIDHPEQSDLIGWSPLGPYDLVDPLYDASEPHVLALNTFARPGRKGIVIDPEPPESLAVTWMPRSTFVRNAESFRQRTARIDGARLQ